MRLTQLDLNLFPVFDAIYSKRNLTRAAEQLCITQPAVSNALARMRKAFNDQLFVSTSRGMVPTPVSENIHQRISEALQLLDSSVLEADSFIPEQSKKVFRLSMNDLTEGLLLPPLIKALQDEAPGIRLESYFTQRRDIARELSTSGIDLAIDAPLINDPQLCHEPLLSTNYVCMLRRDHPLAEQPLTMERYLGLDHIHISSRRRGVGAIDAELNRLGKSREIKMRVQHYLMAPLIAMQSDLALSAPAQLLHHYDAVFKELPFELAPSSWHLYWHRSAEQDAASRWLRNRIVKLVTASA